MAECACGMLGFSKQTAAASLRKPMESMLGGSCLVMPAPLQQDSVVAGPLRPRQPLHQRQTATFSAIREQSCKAISSRPTGTAPTAQMLRAAGAAAHVSELGGVRRSQSGAHEASPAGSSKRPRGTTYASRWAARWAARCGIIVPERPKTEHKRRRKKKLKGARKDKKQKKLKKEKKGKKEKARGAKRTREGGEGEGKERRKKKKAGKKSKKEKQQPQ